MNRRFASDTTATATTPIADTATPLARRGIAISGAGRRLGISGMRRPLLENTTTTTTPDDTNEGLP